ncbi:alpha/beta hydrolase [Nocardia rhamnosiphila]|uniref:alpha/beta hydrolase n=1 Tax=Nocardia rhamnosiphila TaxID=426716 RepID=UPI003406D5FB
MPIPPLDPDIAARIGAAYATVRPMREQGLQAVRAELESMPSAPDVPEMARVDERIIPGPHGPIPLRIYYPEIREQAPVLVHLHGGGLVMGSNDSFEPMARHFAAATGAVVVGVDYRLAPEHPAPVQFDESYAATAWVSEHADEIGVDPARLVLLGDSAGGSLAAAVALAARDRGGPNLFCQVLLYAGLDRDMSAPSMLAMPEAPLLRREDIFFMHELADTGAGTPTDPYRVPAYAPDLSGLPQAIVATGACDPIRDWSERYAVRLRDAGVQTTMTRYPGMPHGFLMRSAGSVRAALAIAETGALLKAKFLHPVSFPQ